MRLVLWFIITASALAQNGVERIFYPDGKIESEITYRDSIREGEAKFFDENGNIKEERYYLNGRVDGLVKIYSDSGKLKEVFVIEEGKREGPTNLFDENGNYLSDVYYEAGRLVIPAAVEDYYASSEIKSENNSTAEKKEEPEIKPRVIKPKKTTEEMLFPPEIEEEKLEDDPAFFSTVEIMPEPVGGIEAIYKKLFYPSQAKNNEIEGTVKIQAMVDEYGEVLDAVVVEGIGYGCDDAAKNAVYYAKFKPGLQRGKPVRAMITIPIKFGPELDKNRN